MKIAIALAAVLPSTADSAENYSEYALVTVDGLDVSVEVFDDNWEMRDSFGYTESECADGTDNDGDGHIDFPNDPGCRNGDSNFEYAACQDGRDNDGDGKIDFDGGLSVFGPGDPRITESRSALRELLPQQGVTHEWRWVWDGRGVGDALPAASIWLHRRGSRRA